MKTVLNKRNIDQLRNPMFLGEDLSLQRYDLIKYPKFYDLYDQQLNFFWRPQEVFVWLIQQSWRFRRTIWLTLTLRGKRNPSS